MTLTEILVKLWEVANRTNQPIGRIISDAAYYTAARGDIYELTNEQLARYLDERTRAIITVDEFMEKVAST